MLTAILVPLFYVLKKRAFSPRRIAVAAMCAAVVVAVFMVEVPTPLGPVHLSFTPLVGMLVGPGLGALVMLVVNLFSAAIGHGGWSMIPANTLVGMLEVTIGYYAFSLLRRKLGIDRFWAGFSSSALALTAGALAVVLIIGISGIQGSDLSREEVFRNTLVLAILNVGIGIIEGVVTGFVVSFVGKVRPDMLGEKAPELPSPASAEPGRA